VDHRVRAVVTEVYVSADVLNLDRYAGQVIAQAVVCVPKVVEQDNHGVQQVQQDVVALQVTTGVILHTMVIVVLFVTNVQVHGLQMRMAEMLTEAGTSVVLHIGIVIQTVTVQLLHTLLLLQAFIPSAAALFLIQWTQTTDIQSGQVWH
jgi:hypothetical protein